MARGKKGTRDSELTEKIADELVRILRMGQPIKVACSFAGISTETFHNYLRLGKGKPDTHILARFSVEVSKAKEAARILAVGSVFKGMQKDWKAAAWFLGVTNPKDFGPKIRVTLEAEFESAMERLKKALPPEMYEIAVDALIQGDGAEGEGEDSLGEIGPRLR